MYNIVTGKLRNFLVKGKLFSSFEHLELLLCVVGVLMCQCCTKQDKNSKGLKCIFSSLLNSARLSEKRQHCGSLAIVLLF